MGGRDVQRGLWPLIVTVAVLIAGAVGLAESSVAEAATKPLVWIGSPAFKDAETKKYVQWPTNSFSRPKDHHVIWGNDWSVDLNGGNLTTSTPLYLYAAPKDSTQTITAKVTELRDVNCKDGGTAGKLVRVTLYSGRSAIGSVLYAHVKPTQAITTAFTKGTPIALWETLIGTAGEYPSAPDTCWDGLHLHMEFNTEGSSAPFVCFNKGYKSGSKLYSSNFLGFVGGTATQTATTAKTACP